MATFGQRTGTVYLVVVLCNAGTDDMTCCVDGYWDSTPEQPDEGFLGQLPPGLSLRAAIAWARERTDRVLVRNDVEGVAIPVGEYFWAGPGEPTVDIRRLADDAPDVGGAT